MDFPVIDVIVDNHLANVINYNNNDCNFYGQLQLNFNYCKTVINYNTLHLSLPIITAIYYTSLRYSLINTVFIY